METMVLTALAVFVGLQLNQLLTATVVSVVRMRRERRARGELTKMFKADIQAVRRRKLQDCDCPSCSQERKLGVN